MSIDLQTDPVRRSVLLTTVSDLHEPPRFLTSATEFATKHTTENLRIIFISSLFNPPEISTSSPPALQPHQRAGISRTEHWDDVQRLLTFVYAQATKVAQEMGKVLMDVDVLLKGTQEPLPETLIQDAEHIFCVAPRLTPLSPLLAPFERRRAEFIWLRPDEQPAHPSPPPPTASSHTDLPPLYPVVALGGTFDHLHAGHKILLSMAAWIASEKLIVGITDDPLLVKKVNREVLEKLPVRTARTRAFLELFKPGLEYDIVPISDVYGPTAWDPNIQALVVSKETLSGAASIEKIRREKALPALRVFVIDVISSTEASVDSEDADALKKAKLSSTFIREWIVQQQKSSDVA
ncbi:Nucleotidylyl transferase [Obba rivulosa]|uniref:Nucleotidylyl transferase n=1 Tax=Obba rivulosa TaxID=1052685 RepID=A0A8E2DPN5_9APHY|nr:Nucleotidylyl transferase [Obba rivulosa]